MIEFEGINIWAIVVTWILYMGVGAFWYSSAGFAKYWTKYSGIDILKIPQKQATTIISFVAVSCLIQVIALALILHSLAIADVVSGVAVTLLIWLSFVTATTVGVTLYSQRSWKFLWLNSAYFLVVMTVGAIILSVWQ